MRTYNTGEVQTTVETNKLISANRVMLHEQQMMTAIRD